MTETDVLQSDAFGYCLGYFYFLADGIDEVELAVGKHDCQRYAGKSASATEVHYLGTWLETDDFGYSEGVKYMVLVKIFYVFTGNHIYL